jgi:hypothetical protein
MDINDMIGSTSYIAPEDGAPAGGVDYWGQTPLIQTEVKPDRD